MLQVMKQKIVYIDMDDVLCQYTRQFQIDIKKNPHIQYPQSQYGFFSDLLPMDGAIDAMAALFNSPYYDPYILTAPSYMNPLCYTEKRMWVEKHLGIDYVKRLIICPNKGLMNGDLLIDDNHQGKGQENFKGELIKFGSVLYNDWECVRTYLLV